MPSPRYEDFRIQLRYALAVTRLDAPELETPGLESLDELEEKVRPHTRKQIEELEKRFVTALEELAKIRAQLGSS
jgi:hypothetical protein